MKDGGRHRRPRRQTLAPAFAGLRAAPALDVRRIGLRTWVATVVVVWAVFWFVGDLWGLLTGAASLTTQAIWASLAVSGAMIAVALDRRRWALLSVAVALGAYVGEEFDSGRPTTFASFIGVALLVASAGAVKADRRVTLLAMSAFSVGCAVLIGMHPGMTQSILFLALPITALVPFTFWGLGDAIRRWRAAEAERDRMAAQAFQAREKERLLLARELHDVVAHELTIVAMQASLMRFTQDPHELDSARDAIERTARTALDELKRLMQVLRTSEELDEGAVPSDRSVPATVEALAAQLQRLGRHVTQEVAVGKLPRSVELAIGRVLREASTNIVKHSTEDAAVEISVVQYPGGLHVRVANDGMKPRGMARLSSTRMGLPGLEERLALLGGTFSARADGDRWVLRAYVPLVPPPGGESHGATALHAGGPLR